MHICCCCCRRCCFAATIAAAADAAAHHNNGRVPKLLGSVPRRSAYAAETAGRSTRGVDVWRVFCMLLALLQMGSTLLLLLLLLLWSTT
jgi:hypothetical protein